MLRDPIEHSISSLEMLRRLPQLRKKYNISEEDSFENLVESKIPFNLQTQFIAVDADIVESIKSVDLKNFSDFNFRDLKEYSQSEILNQKMIELAKKHLSEFAFVGLTEKFDESVLLLCYTFNLLPIQSKIKVNVGKKRIRQENLSKKSIDIIKERTNLDKELYDYGNSLFERRYFEMVDDLKENYFDEKFSNLPQTKINYEMLKIRYVKKYGKIKYLKEYFLYNVRKINFIIRYGWNSRIKSKLIGKNRP